MQLASQGTTVILIIGLNQRSRDFVAGNLWVCVLLLINESGHEEAGEERFRLGDASQGSPVASQRRQHERKRSDRSEEVSNLGPYEILIKLSTKGGGGGEERVKGSHFFLLPKFVN